MPIDIFQELPVLLPSHQLVSRQQHVVAVGVDQVGSLLAALGEGPVVSLDDERRAPTFNFVAPLDER
jgi:hypothetical protein